MRSPFILLLLFSTGCANRELAPSRDALPSPDIRENYLEGVVQHIEAPAVGQVGTPVSFIVSGWFGLCTATVDEVRLEPAPEQKYQVRVIGHYFYDLNHPDTLPASCINYTASGSFLPIATGSYELFGASASTTIRIQ